MAWAMNGKEFLPHFPFLFLFSLFFLISYFPVPRIPPMLFLFSLFSFLYSSLVPAFPSIRISTCTLSRYNSVVEYGIVEAILFSRMWSSCIFQDDTYVCVFSSLKVEAASSRIIDLSSRMASRKRQFRLHYVKFIYFRLAVSHSEIEKKIVKQAVIKIVWKERKR